MPTPQDQTLLRVLLNNIQKLSAPAEAATQTPSGPPPDSWGLADRTAARQGLPGATPPIDPRLVDPTNNPMMSAGGLKRGDITLPPQGSGQPATEDPSRMLALMAKLKQLGLTR